MNTLENSFHSNDSKRRCALFILLIIGAAALAGVFLCENKCRALSIRDTQNYTDEQILALPYFDILAASEENGNLPCDVVSYSLGDGYIHLMLPEDVNKKAVTVYIRDKDGNLLARRIYDLTQVVMIGPWIVTAEQHNLPVLYFDTEDPDVFSAMNASATKDIICKGDMYICVNKSDSDKNGWFREYSSKAANRLSGSSASLQGRGCASWEMSDSKKSYTLRLNKAENLLGMGSNRSWNLIGNAFDPSLIKNTAFNEISDRAGLDYQPQMRSINLYVDGVYQGVYTLTTKVKVGKNKISLKKGDYLFRMDPPLQDQPIWFESSVWFDEEGEHPVADVLYPEAASDEQMERATQIIKRFAKALESTDPEELSKICDLRSLATYYWIEEASMNFDAWHRSLYMYYKEADGLIHFGPVWDMDLALGSPYTRENVPARFDVPQGWIVRYGDWYKAIFKNDIFCKEAADVYFNGGVREELLNGVKVFEENRSALGQDAYLNYLIYGRANPDHNLDHGDTYDSYCENMISFYKTRVYWIDETMERER